MLIFFGRLKNAVLVPALAPFGLSQQKGDAR